jgi:hypothetical protein
MKTKNKMNLNLHPYSVQTFLGCSRFSINLIVSQGQSVLEIINKFTLTKRKEINEIEEDR